MKNLTLNVKKKWFDMILSGEKKEEYREITERRIRQLSNPFYIIGFQNPKYGVYDTVTFLNGMKPKTPKIIIECRGIRIGKAKPEWSDNWQGDVFIIELGRIIETTNCA